MGCHSIATTIYPSYFSLSSSGQQSASRLSALTVCVAGWGSGPRAPDQGHFTLRLAVQGPHFWGFTITLRHTTLGRIPLDKWPARRRDLYLTTHTTHKRQTSMPPAGFESVIPASERPLSYVLYWATSGIGHQKFLSFAANLYEQRACTLNLGMESERKGIELSAFVFYSWNTGSSKKMDGIWNRYNLKSTGRIYTFGVLKCSEKFKVVDLP